MPLHPVRLPFSFLQTLWLHSLPTVEQVPRLVAQPLEAQTRAAASSFARVRALVDACVLNDGINRAVRRAVHRVLVDTVSSRPIVVLVADALFSHDARTASYADAYTNLATDATAQIVATQRGWRPPAPRVAFAALRTRAARLRVDAIDLRGPEAFTAYKDPGALSQLAERFLKIEDTAVPARARFFVPPGTTLEGGPGDFCHAARLEDAPVWLQALGKAALELRLETGTPDPSIATAVPVDARTLEQAARTWHPYVVDVDLRRTGAARWAFELVGPYTKSARQSLRGGALPEWPPRLPKKYLKVRRERRAAREAEAKRLGAQLDRELQGAKTFALLGERNVSGTLRYGGGATIAADADDDGADADGGAGDAVLADDGADDAAFADDGADDAAFSDDGADEAEGDGGDDISDDDSSSNGGNDSGSDRSSVDGGNNDSGSEDEDEDGDDGAGGAAGASTPSDAMGAVDDVRGWDAGDRQPWPSTVLEALRLAERGRAFGGRAAEFEERHALLWNVDRVYQLLLLHATDSAQFGSSLAIDLRRTVDAPRAWTKRAIRHIVMAVTLATAYAATVIAANVPVIVHVDAEHRGDADRATRIATQLAARAAIRAAPLAEVVAALTPALLTD